MSTKADIQKTIDDYNTAITNYQPQTNTIFSSKYSELLGKDNSVVHQMKGIKEDRANKAKANKLTPLQLEKDRHAFQQEINREQAQATTVLDDNDTKLNNYLINKTSSNAGLINTLQDSIYTRDKTIYLNNSDAHDKHVLVKTLLTLLLLVVVLAVISFLHMFRLIKPHITLIVSVLVTVVFVYKIIRTYYWRETVHTMDESAAMVSASLRSLVGDKACPICDNTDYCASHLKKKHEKDKHYCKTHKDDICCQTGNFCNALRKQNPKFCEDPNTKVNHPDQYYTCCKHNWPEGVAILDNDTNMNLL